MKLTINEKKTLRLLLSNSRISDTIISKRLHITSQAVGKIRRKLEHSIIKSYSLKIDYAKLGIDVFVLAIGKTTPEGIDLGDESIKKHFIDEEHVLEAFHLPSSNSSHAILLGFTSLPEMERFFHSHSSNALKRIFEAKEIYTFSSQSMIKSDICQLIDKILNQTNEFGI